MISLPKKSVIRATVLTTLKQPYSTTFAPVKGKYIYDKSKVAEFSKLNEHGLQRVWDDATQKTWDVPYISGTSRKAVMFRQACASKVLETVLASGNKVSLSRVLSLMTGTEETAQSNKDIKAAGGSTTENLTNENAWRAEHPLQSLFGTFKVGSQIEVSAAFPTILDEKFISYLGGARMDAVSGWYEHLEPAEQEQYLLLKNLITDKSLMEADVVRKGVELRKTEEGSQTAIDLEKEIKKMNAAIEKMEKQMNGFDIALLMPIPPRHIAIPGMQFESSWTLRNPQSITPLSMALYGLNEFSRFPKLGAFQTAGGEVEEIHTVSLHDYSGDVAQINELFTLKIGGYNDFEIVDISELGKEYLEAAKADTSWIDKV